MPRPGTRCWRRLTSSASVRATSSARCSTLRGPVRAAGNGCRCGRCLHRRCALSAARCRRASTSALPSPTTSPWPATRSGCQQAFLNLIKNAVQALPGEGRVAITAVAARISGEAARGQAPFEGCHVDGDVVDVCIADSAVPAIAAEVLPRIFDPSSDQDVGGHGTGAVITHEIIEEHDGCVAVTTAQASAPRSMCGCRRHRRWRRRPCRSGHDDRRRTTPDRPMTKTSRAAQPAARDD